MTTRLASGRETLVGFGVPQPVPITLDAATYAGALVYGSDARFYRSNGITWLLEEHQVFNTDAPNATIPVMVVRPDPSQNAATNVDVAIAPRGTGALIADVPDGTAAGGGKRGTNAVDLQTVRAAASQVASGSLAVIGGGSNNTASAELATVGGGGGNSALAAQSTISGGQNNIASGVNSTICGGFGNTASGQSAAMLGTVFSIASGQHSTIGGGIFNFASGQYSAIPGGVGGTTRGLRGRLSFQSSSFSQPGDSQYGLHVLRFDGEDSSTLTAAPNDQFEEAPSLDNIPTLPNNSLYAFRIRVVCIQTGGSAGVAGDSKAWDVVGAIKRGANAAATALLGTPTITVLGADTNLGADNATGATIDIAADTTNGGLLVNVTGQANKNLRWVATVETTEVAF